MIIYFVLHCRSSCCNSQPEFSIELKEKKYKYNSIPICIPPCCSSSRSLLPARVTKQKSTRPGRGSENNSVCICAEHDEKCRSPPVFAWISALLRLEYDFYQLSKVPAQKRRTHYQSIQESSAVEVKESPAPFALFQRCWRWRCGKAQLQPPAQYMTESSQTAVLSLNY